MRPPSAKRIRRRYTNTQYPFVLLRFEDGHEIGVRRGEGREFDAFAGEVVKICVIWDPSSSERDVVASLRAEQFDDAR